MEDSEEKGSTESGGVGGEGFAGRPRFRGSVV